MRAVFTPIAMVLASLHATAMVPPADWTQPFGLGGHLGDMVMGGMMGMLPFSAVVALKLLAFISDKDLFAEFYRKRLSRCAAAGPCDTRSCA